MKVMVEKEITVCNDCPHHKEDKNHPIGGGTRPVGSNLVEGSMFAMRNIHFAGQMEQFTIYRCYCDLDETIVMKDSMPSCSWSGSIADGIRLRKHVIPYNCPLRKLKSKEEMGL